MIHWLNDIDKTFVLLKKVVPQFIESSHRIEYNTKLEKKENNAQ